MANQELKIWANTLDIDGVAGNAQRRDLIEEEFIDGWKRLAGVSYQQLNQLFYLLTSSSAPIDTAPYLHYTVGNPVPSVALEMNGQTITEAANPILFGYYGGTLPDLRSEAPTNFTYLVRNH